MSSQMQQAQEAFERQHPKPQKLFIGSTSTNWTMKNFWDQHSRGGTQSIICYTPPGVDSIRWKLGRYWTPEGTVYDTYRTELPNGTPVGSLSPNPLWVLGAKPGQSIYSPGTNQTFNSFPDNPTNGGEYQWSEIPDNCNQCVLKGEKKETLVVGQGSLNWGLNTDQAWIWSVDSNQLTSDPNGFKYKDEPLASAFGEGGVKGRIFYDHAFDLELPFQKSDIGARDFGSVRQLYVDIKPVYNFYAQSYETKITNSDIEEKILPNMYAFLLVEQEQDPQDVILIDDPTTVDDIFERHLTLNNEMGGTMFTVDHTGMPLSREVLSQRGQMTFQKSNKNQYFDKWSRSYDDFAASSDANILSNRFSNIIVPMSDLNLYRDFDSKKNQFPMYVDINFSTDVTKTFLADALKESQLSSLFMKDMVNPANKFEPKEFTSAASEIQIPQNFNYGPIGVRAGPAVFVWWGPRYTGLRENERVSNQTPNPYWGAGGGMWTSLTNIEHDETSLNGTGYRIGDWIKVKKGVHWGNAYHDDQRAQIIGYSTNAKPIANLIRDQGQRNRWVREVYEFADDPSVSFYPDTPDFRQQLRERQADTRRNAGPISHQAYALYGENDTIETARSQPALERDFSLTNTTREESVISGLNEWDITRWFDEFIASPVESFTTGSANMVFMGQHNEDVAEADSSANFYKTLTSIIFGGKFNQLVNEKTRSYQQILAGKKAHSEAVFYKVEKWRLDELGNPQGTEPSQSIIFPNSSAIDAHNYIDTQVKYNQRYLYRLYAFVAVFGTRYRYSLDGITGQEPPPLTPNPNLAGPLRKAEICVFTSPSVRLIQVPYGQFTGLVMDSPPIWPDVDVIQYRNHNDKVLFFFRGNVGNYKAKPIAIEPTDYDSIIRLAEAQNLRQNDSMEFKSDDQARVFQIFRRDSKPSSYADFEDFKLIDVQSDTFPDPKKAATAGAYLDNIVPNKKYYYIFRTVDVHGHVSNPTPIYEIEIIDHDGGPVLVTNVFQLQEEKNPPQFPVKTAKKYIYITPNAEQLEINKVQSNLLEPSTGANKIVIPESVKIEGAALGEREEVVWDKNYKIRVTSKKTGRKIDFNLQCKVKPWVNTTDG